jgi:hypothetical protein
MKILNIRGLSEVIILFTNAKGLKYINNISFMKMLSIVYFKR